MKLERSAGDRVDLRFELERKIGSGGFGQVWLARDLELGKRVALKILREPEKQAQMILSRFEREARVVSELDHPNIARAIAWSIEARPAYIAMDYVEGVSLERVMLEHAKNNTHFTPAELERIFDQLCSAVAYAHQHGIVHRDLKPSNVMVDPARDHALKVLDFGIAKLMEEDSAGATTVGRFLGTPYYLSPEQIQSSGVDFSTDIFTLGTVLFELLTLTRAWAVDEHDRPRPLTEEPSKENAKQDRIAAIARIARGPRPRPSSVRPELGAELDRLIARATAIEPRDRPATVGDLARAFHAVLTGEETVRVESPPDASGVLETATIEQAPPDYFTQVMPRDMDTLSEGVSLTPVKIEAVPRARSAVQVRVLTHSTARRATTLMAIASFGIALAALGIALGISRAKNDKMEVLAAEDTASIRVVPVAREEERAEAPTPTRQTPPQLEQAPAQLEAPVLEAARSTKKHVPAATRENASKSDAKSPQKFESEPTPTKTNPLAQVDMLLGRARGTDDFARVDALSESIIAHAKQLCSPEDAKAIQRCATVAAMVADVEGLARCVDKLRKSIVQDSP